MNKLLYVSMLAITLVACDRQDKMHSPSHMGKDNTGNNVRDREPNRLTPLNQSENEADLAITRRIRQAIMADDALSVNAKNIKIITIDGVVTLRGSVNSQQEKTAIEQKIKNVPGIKSFDNQIEVIRS